MALLDFLKNKKDAEKAQAGKKAAKKPDKSPAGHFDGPATISPKASLGGKPVVKNKSFSYEAIKEPHISEKASYLAEKDQYVFEVSPNYNKNEVKKAVEGIYGVDVLSVNVIKIPPKKRRVGRTEGFRKAYKKAVVRIKQGQKIEIL